MDLLIFCCQINSLGLKDWTAIIALAISIFTLISSRLIAQKNLRLSIQQTIFKTITDKVKDCNVVWDSVPQIEKINADSLHINVISELVITLEIIDNSFLLFEHNYENIRKDYTVNFHKLFYKQLRTDLREWLKKTPEISAKLKDNKVYSDQVAFLTKHLGPYYEISK